MRPPQTPIPPWGSKSRWYMTPTPLSPSFSRHPFQGTAAAASEQPCVTLFEWWLERVEGDDQKVAVAGKFESYLLLASDRNQTVYEFGSATIAKRHEVCVLETEGGILLLIYGTLNRSRMLAGGYSSEVYEKFKIGFPYCWEYCIQLYPKVAQTGLDSAINENAAVSNDGGERHEAACNEAYNVETDLIACRALRERDDGGIDTNASLVHIVECANDASNEEADNATPTITCDQGKAQHVALSKKAKVNENVPTFVCLDMQNSSDLPKGTPRFQEYTCDGDIATNENAAASNDDGEKDEDEYNDVNNVFECANDASNEEADNPPPTSKKRDLVVPLKTQGCEKTQHTAKRDPAPSCVKPLIMVLQNLECASKEPSGPPKKQRSALEKLQGATRSPFTSPVPYARETPLTRGRAMSLSMSTPEDLKLRKTRSGRVVVPTLDAGCQRIVYDMDGTITGVIGLDSPLPKGSKLKTARRKREAEPPSKLKTYARKKRRAQ
ncbi:uncharacterized protein LOC120693899 [Panicum virgatum]|uniref:uncharacterized protein LOC120693899 n=1 Tax=Panicum virgatum TaxID=38727 RepID=UPI0019D57F76|nr:uncharacterized protein LOC120693899 [Panicum virgatum]